jgi:ABC-type bacteriocin/lantibiotic exporter with double-glycine peptidase domain
VFSLTLAFILIFSIVDAHGESPSSVTNCGIDAIYLACQLIDFPVDLDDLRLNLKRDENNASSIHDLEEYLRTQGLYTKALWLSERKLAKMKVQTGIMLHTKCEHGSNTGHYLVVRTVGNGRIQYIDANRLPFITETKNHTRTKYPIILIYKNPPPKGWKIGVWGIGAILAISLCAAAYVYFLSTQRKA